MKPQPGSGSCLEGGCFTAETLLMPQELALIRQVFAELDRDRDGWLSPEDLRRSMLRDGISVTKAEAETFLWEVDEDGDGRLALSDFALLYAFAKRGLRRREPQKLSNYLIYRLIDLDRDGRLDTDHVYSYLCHIMDKEAANRNMNKIFGFYAVDSPTTAKVTPAQWLTILETSLWEQDCPVVDNEKAPRQTDTNSVVFPLLKDRVQARPRVDDRLDIQKLRDTRNQVVAETGTIPREPYSRGRRSPICPPQRRNAKRR
ncbi:UNVERIFIED_CONTAM: EF hand domain-containing protein [Hammondia hammondi]|eukprot:XP_008887568.1 EF hand domain-containing protein [Hammondia hammondi]